MRFTACCSCRHCHWPRAHEWGSGHAKLRVFLAEESLESDTDLRPKQPDVPVTSGSLLAKVSVGQYSSVNSRKKWMHQQSKRYIAEGPSEITIHKELALTSIAVISDRQILAEGIRNVIAGMSDFVLSAIYPSRDFFIGGLEEREPTRLLLVDAASAATLDALKELRSSAPGTFVILWVDGIVPEFAHQALQVGVRAILPKAASIEIHADCIRRVANNETWIERELCETVLSARLTHVSVREQQLMALLAQGLKNKEIAWQLKITEGTVKVYLSRLFAKVGANDRFELALLALRNLVPDQSLRRDRAHARSRQLSFASSRVVTIPHATSDAH